MPNNLLDELQTNPSDLLIEIDGLNSKAESRYCGILRESKHLSRAVVSFQANKTRPVYRWFKYKEGFSAVLVERSLEAFGVTTGELLDPFAGVGTSLFAASALGIKSHGIELLPIGQQVITTKQLVDGGLTSHEIVTITRWLRDKPWQALTPDFVLNELRITKGAFPIETASDISKFMTGISYESEHVRTILFFALLCVLEQISFTRKNWQCWELTKRI